MIYLGILVFIILPVLGALWIATMVAQEYRSDRVPILLYHRLISKAAAERGEVPDDEMIWVSYDTTFAEQMAYLKREGYTTLDLDDYVAIRRGESPMPSKPVIITFDDGYTSNYDYAYPALKANGLKATIFIAPEPDEHTRELVAGVDGFLNVDQMRELSSNGISIQSHTLTHCILNELDDASADHELRASMDYLSNALKHPIRHIAIPRSGYSRRIRHRVKEAGYETACCNNKGSANGRSDLLALPRIVIERDMSIEEFGHALTSRGTAVLRVVGNLKRIPERLGGAQFALKVRDFLYGSPLKALFETRNMKKVVVLLGLLYAAGSVAFLIYLLRWMTWFPLP